VNSDVATTLSHAPTGAATIINSVADLRAIQAKPLAQQRNASGRNTRSLNSHPESRLKPD
jgi:hypothetical protein